MLERPISIDAFKGLVVSLMAAGYGDDIQWSETVGPPEDADEFAREAVFVICNSGMQHRIAAVIFERVLGHLRLGGLSGAVFGHKGKCSAIDKIWAEREQLFTDYMAAPDKLAFCESLPWIGPITKFHLAKNFGVDVAKPDVHLQRLADWEGTTAQDLCSRLALESGYRARTVDVILWRACAIGLIDSRALVQ